VAKAVDNGGENAAAEGSPIKKNNLMNENE